MNIWLVQVLIVLTFIKIGRINNGDIESTMDKMNYKRKREILLGLTPSGNLFII